MIAIAPLLQRCSCKSLAAQRSQAQKQTHQLLYREIKNYDRPLRAGSGFGAEPSMFLS